MLRGADVGDVFDMTDVDIVIDKIIMI